MKTLAITIGPIMLVDPTTNFILPDDRPAVCPWSAFFEARTGRGQIKVLQADLLDEATDEEFQKYLTDSDGDVDLAVASFIATYGNEADEADEGDPPSREELEEAATALDIKFSPKISDEKLLERITEAQE